MQTKKMKLPELDLRSSDTSKFSSLINGLLVSKYSHLKQADWFLNVLRSEFVWLETASLINDQHFT